MSIRTYQEMVQYPTFRERLSYLMLRGEVAEPTFGGLRHINQQFYKSSAWSSVRNHVIIRDSGHDLGIPDREVHGPIFVHHMNPVTPHVLIHDVDLALDPMYLITVSFKTHQIIHFSMQIPEDPVYHVRRPGDTKLW